MQYLSKAKARKAEPLEKRLADRLSSSGKTVSVAESCTGGLLAHRLTTIPGSSAYFIGGVIAYDNDVKISVLRVPEELLRSAGAVSAEVARAMAEGAVRLFGTDIGVSVTGIAGPGGGTPDKPVGTAFIGFAMKGKLSTKKVCFGGSRLLNKIHFSQSALEMLMDVL